MKVHHDEDGTTFYDEWWLATGSDDRARFSRPVPSSDGRALHRELLGGRNTVSKLMCREIGQRRGRMPPRPDVNFCTEKFRRFKLQEQFFVHDGVDQTSGTTISVSGIIAANDFIFVVASCGVCMVFRQTKNDSIAPYRRDGQIWYLNNLDEWIEFVFYNKINDSIIIVSSARQGNGYKTRALPLEGIRRSDHWDNGVQIFGVSIGLPIFHDDSNIAVVPHTDVDNVHEMNNYKLVHSFSNNKNILYITPRPGILIVAYRLTKTYLPIEVVSTENWAVLKKVNYAVPPSGFELLCIGRENNILLKEKGKKIVHMINIWDSTMNLIKQTNKHHKLLTIYDLTAKRLLMRFNKNIVVAYCNSHDEHQVALLEDNEVPSNCKDDDNGYFDSTYVTRDNNYAIIYSRKHIEMPREGINECQEFSSIGSINIYNTFNGESIWKINPYDDADLGIATRKEGGNNMTNSLHEALQDVTTIFYDEEQHRIYTGNKRGFFHVWSN